LYKALILIKTYESGMAFGKCPPDFYSKENSE